MILDISRPGNSNVLNLRYFPSGNALTQMDVNEQSLVITASPDQAYVPETGCELITRPINYTDVDLVNCSPDYGRRSPVW